ncbi:division plane positioning ATPase MipZ [Pantoea stewartii]|uniref:division plane positioning ATPase MipZ n=1 Tax=Pantoea stewartii TaxID=66269 RepID=UPI0025A21C05|nr:division plane positioning ATPase MipZ [Pantoea stewartii]
MISWEGYIDRWSEGGGSKSTKARTLAVGFSEAGWKTHLADIDTKQQTSLKWTERREKSGLSTIDCALYRRVETAVRMKDSCHLLIIDGRPAAEQHHWMSQMNLTSSLLPQGLLLMI